MAEAIITVAKTNWDRCFICQQDTKEKLIQPSLFNREHIHIGYDTIARNVSLFHKINALPILLCPTQLDEGDGIESTLTRNRAKYHSSCKLMFNNTKGPILRSAQITFYTDACIVASLHPAQSWFSPGATRRHYTCAWRGGSTERCYLVLF